jgi:uncharacterized membrane protein
MYSWLKFAHFLAVFMLAVGDIGALLVAIRARRAGTSAEIHTLMKMHQFTVRCGIIPGAIGSLLTGIGLVQLMGLSWSTTWIAGAFAAWIASLLVGVGLLVPAEGKALAEAQRLLAANTDVPSAELRRHVGAPRVFLGEWSTVVFFVVMAWLMVFKPS